jgi:DNA-binding transcriptional LysR family regulator
MTPAGETLLSYVAPGLRRLDAGVAATRVVLSGETGELRVAFLSPLAAPAVPRIAAAFREVRPRVELRMTEATLGRQLDELPAGRIDVALFSDFDGVEFDAGGLQLDRFVQGPQFVALPEDHPRAGARSIAPGDLADEPFVMPSGTDDAGYEAPSSRSAAVRASPSRRVPKQTT